MTFDNHTEYDIKLIEDIQKFKLRFKNSDIEHSPELCALNKLFGHTDIEQLDILDLMALGFQSDNITMAHIEHAENISMIKEQINRR